MNGSRSAGAKRARCAGVAVLALSLLAVPGAASPLTPRAVPACLDPHRCHHVFHVGPSTSPTRHASWDSPQLFARGPIHIGIRYSPHLPYDTELHLEPIGDCGLHFWINGRFTGVATRCGRGRLPLHVQVANVSRKHLRLGVTYWIPAPLFAG